MTDKFTPEQIYRYWEQQALEHEQSPTASWSDKMVIEMEIREILRWLSDDDHVLDIGCANGYSTLQLASQKRLYIRGLDYIPEMIIQANSRLSSFDIKLNGTVEFAVGDITTLSEPSETYDKVAVIRVIINLGSWDNQLKGLRESARVLKRGGMLLLSEATIQGWSRLNAFRKEWGLDSIPMPPFNSYLDQEKVVQALAPDLRLVEMINFASTYYVGTRVLKPLLTQALHANINSADPNMEWNRWFSMLPAAGDYGTQKLFVFEKQ
jgi:ubiquinone/menaquinone biosynthesis C-methylase UbiE